MVEGLTMMWHVVLLKPRADLSIAGRQALLAAFDRAVREVPSVRDVRIGTRITHGAGYEAGMPDSADFLISIAFADLAGLQTYLRHPAHEQLAARFYESLSSALIYDFAVGGVEDVVERGVLGKLVWRRSVDLP